MEGTELFLIKDYLLFNDHNIAVKDLWDRFFIYLEKTNFKTIFTHNLGGFDGIYIHKAASNYYDVNHVKTIIDDSNKFILINVLLNNNNNIVFKDSMIIFPVSLNDLCEIFHVPGKTSKYIQDFNKINLFKNKKLLKEFILYSKQDSLGLYNALVNAQTSIINELNVDITTIVSTSSLALKAFRTNFQKVIIPILKSSEDKFIRDSYYGGRTDYYKAKVNNLFYYDVGGKNMLMNLALFVINNISVIDYSFVVYTFINIIFTFS